MTPMNSGISPCMSAKHVKQASHWEHLRSNDYSIVRFKMPMRPSSEATNTNPHPSESANCEQGQNDLGNV